MKKKELLKKCLFTSLLLIPLIVFATSSTSSSMNSDETPLIAIIGMEAFVSIHMSVFVLRPLASLINRNKSTQIFGILFVLRLIILIIGDILWGMGMAIFDFLAVFIGAFILIPVLGGLKYIKYRGNLRYNEYVEVDELALISFGIKDGNLIKDKLFKIFCQVQEAFSNDNRQALDKLCSTELKNSLYNSLDLLKENKQINKITDIKNVDNKIINLQNKTSYLYADMIQKVELKDYTLDEYNRLVDGSDTTTLKYIYLLKFRKDITSSKKTNPKNCPNCGAPLDENSNKCSYCGTPLNNRLSNKEWLLDNMKIIQEDK